jgi:hypothetical protein
VEQKYFRRFWLQKSVSWMEVKEQRMVFVKRTVSAHLQKIKQS